MPTINIWGSSPLPTHKLHVGNQHDYDFDPTPSNTHFVGGIIQIPFTLKKTVLANRDLRIDLSTHSNSSYGTYKHKATLYEYKEVSSEWTKVEINNGNVPNSGSDNTQINFNTITDNNRKYFIIQMEMDYENEPNSPSKIGEVILEAIDLDIITRGSTASDISTSLGFNAAL